MPLLIAEDVSSRERALGTLGIDVRRALHPQLFARLLGAYRTAIRAYRGDEAVLRLLLRLHEIENLKLVWRAVARKETPAAWLPLWQDLGNLATIDPEPLRGVTSLHDLAARVARTPYGAIAERIESAHAADLAAAELAFDRWGIETLLDAARALPPREELTRLLVESVADERVDDLRRRGERIYGISAAALAAMTSDIIRATPGVGGKGCGNPARPRRLADRRRLVARAFIGRTFELAPAVALVLLAEDELRGVNALAESRDGAARAAAERIVAEGAMAG